MHTDTIILRKLWEIGLTCQTLGYNKSKSHKYRAWFTKNLALVTTFFLLLFYWLKNTGNKKNKPDNNPEWCTLGRFGGMITGPIPATASLGVYWDGMVRQRQFHLSLQHQALCELSYSLFHDEGVKGVQNSSRSGTSYRSVYPYYRWNRIRLSVYHQIGVIPDYIWLLLQLTKGDMITHFTVYALELWPICVHW